MMTDEQKFLFDLNGFLVIEDILSADQCEKIKQQVYLMTHDPLKLDTAYRRVPGGELEYLIDHPRIEPIVHELIGPNPRLDHG